MSTEARARIDAHPLMRKEVASPHEERVVASRADFEVRKKENAQKWKTVTMVHIAVFVVSFVFTAGLLMLGVLLWVRPDELLSLVLVGLLSSVIFVVLFASLRMYILEHVFPHVRDDVDASDMSESHVLAKSISYGIVALVFAFVIAMLLVQVASAHIL
jgi:small-conductance mechanosensitive channel